MRTSIRYVTLLILGLILAGTMTTQASATQALRTESHTHNVATAALAVSPLVSRLNGTNDSYNWAGYVSSSGAPNSYDDVTATWVVPTVTCTTRGIVLFWIGLDGWYSTTVERTGVGADCTSGSPQYFVQFFTGIEGSSSSAAEGTGIASIQQYPVKPGDSVTAEVLFDYQNTQYDISLSSSEGWSAYNTAAAPLGYQNSSAEIITEAVSNNGAITPLPSFTPTHFTYDTIDGSSLNQSNAQAINMINRAGGVIATTGAYDGTGENFTVTYTGT